MHVDFPDAQNQMFSWQGSSSVGGDNADVLFDSSNRAIARGDVILTSEKPIAGDVTILDPSNAPDAPVLLVMYTELLRLQRLNTRAYIFEDSEGQGYLVRDWYKHLVYEVEWDGKHLLKVFNGDKKACTDQMLYLS